MNSITVIHTADIHLDKLNTDTYETFSRIISYIKQEDIEYLLISGDLFDDKPDINLLTKVNDLFSYINNCRIFIAPGNHDPYTFNSVYNSNVWSKNVHIFKDKLSYYTYDNVRIYGCAFSGHFEKTSLLRSINLDDQYINILVMHGEVDVTNSLYNPISLNELKESNFDYCALGHIHKRINSPYYVYPGIPQGRGFDEVGNLGITVATITKGKYEATHLPICKKRYHVNDLDITNLSTSKTIDKLKHELNNNDYYRVILKGYVDYSHDSIGIASLLKPYCKYIEVIDNTTLSYNLELLKKENSLKGIFVRNMLNQIQQEPDNKVLVDSLYLGLKAFDYDIEEGE